MMDHLTPPPISHLTTSGARARAAAMLNTAGTHAVDGAYLADLLDALSGAALSLAFVPAADARAVLAVLWAER